MLFENNGGIAQLVEHLICIQKVAGSNPTTSTQSCRSSSAGIAGDL